MSTEQTVLLVISGLGWAAVALCFLIILSPPQRTWRRYLSLLAILIWPVSLPVWYVATFCDKLGHILVMIWQRWIRV